VHGIAYHQNQFFFATIDVFIIRDRTSKHGKILSSYDNLENERIFDLLSSRERYKTYQTCYFIFNRGQNRAIWQRWTQIYTLVEHSAWPSNHYVKEVEWVV